MNLKDFIAAIKRTVQQGGSVFLERGRAVDSVGIASNTVIKEKGNWQPKWTIEKWACDADREAGLPPLEVVTIPGNLLLNEGITELLTLLIGGGSATAFSNANARIGVGDDDTAAAAAQTDLQAAVNKLYKAMDATYPQVADQTVTFRSTFTAEEANFVWKEISVDNGSVASKNINRKVQAMGTKASPASWTVSLAITIS